MHVCQTRCRWGCSTNTFVIDCLIDSTFSSKSSKTINLIRDLTRDLQSTRFKIHGGYRERDGQSTKDGNPRVYYRINRKLFYICFFTNLIICCAPLLQKCPQKKQLLILALIWLPSGLLCRSREERIPVLRHKKSGKYQNCHLVHIGSFLFVLVLFFVSFLFFFYISSSSSVRITKI